MAEINAQFRILLECEGPIFCGSQILKLSTRTVGFIRALGSFPVIGHMRTPIPLLDRPELELSSALRWISACASLSVRLQYVLENPAKPIFLKGNGTRKGARELRDESEVFYIREKLDGKILPANTPAEHEDNG
jgi:hypothetical protein